MHGIQERSRPLALRAHILRGTFGSLKGSLVHTSAVSAAIGAAGGAQARRASSAAAGAVQGSSRLMRLACEAGALHTDNLRHTSPIKPASVYPLCWEACVSHALALPRPCSSSHC